MVGTMPLDISIGHYSSAGIKAVNQDALQFKINTGNTRTFKGHACVVADGISSSQVSQDASQLAVDQFLKDYFSTPETWTSEKSINYALKTVNGALLKRTKHSPYRYDKNKGYVCTLSGIVFKGKQAHLFHLGDTRIHRVNQSGFETLTNDHRVWVTHDQSHLSRALGVTEDIKPDYQTLSLEQGDLYIITTDGVHEFVSPDQMIETLAAHGKSIEDAAQSLVAQALAVGSNDNLSVMIISVDSLQEAISPPPLLEKSLAFPPELKEGDRFEDFHILKSLHNTARSHVFLALDIESQSKVILKLPSIDLRESPQYIEQFMLEEWIANRIESPYVLKPYRMNRSRTYVYSVMEYIEGQTLKQWLMDNPAPSVEMVRNIIEQIGKGLRSMHRQDLLHQDIKPDNVIISPAGQIKIIDFGSAYVAGLTEVGIGAERVDRLGTALYSAPEYFLGDGGSERSDQYSLAVLTYHMLSGRYPYGVNIAKAKTVSLQRRLNYQSVLDEDREIPVWLDETLKRALHINPLKRYDDISEYLYDLRYPNRTYLNKSRPPLMERHPKQFWQTLCFLELVFIIYLFSMYVN
jgi:serine/threonine protein phosphatase PrpC